MNIPSGKPIAKGIALKNLNYNNMLLDLMQKKFNGYVCLTVKDKFGYEDSFVIFKEGVILGAYHNFFDVNKESFGEMAIKLFMSCFTAKFGTLEVYALTKEQCELILTFNEKIKNQPIKDIKYLNQFVNPKYRENIVETPIKKEDSKYDLFKKIGLGNLSV